MNQSIDIPPPITSAKRHEVYPQAKHDDRARLNFIMACYRMTANVLTPGNEKVYQARVKPAFEAANQRPPNSRQEVRQAMNQDPFHNLWGALRRNLMEIRQQTGRSVVLKQNQSLADKAAQLNQQSENLELNSEQVIPNYVADVDHHCMPGSYYTELIDADVAPAANYDLGFFATTGGSIGALCDGAGMAVANWVKQHHPDFQPKRMLDIGVAAGHSLVPIAKVFPQTQFIAIDVSAPMLRYAHARAKSLGVDNIKFIQMSGEDLSRFDDESFDWVQSSIFLHELSGKSLPKILAESYRVLAKGGLTLHLEQPQYSDDMPIFEQFMRDWDAYNNNEPFWSAMHATDLDAELETSGFDRDAIFHASIDGVVDPATAEQGSKQLKEDYGRAPAWHAYGAFKQGESSE
ncbi:MAG: class I SAM-dependent methyltransferase [Acidiferrobacterales bacterium]|nr:class I SAM-dependent methyltransferase [Acidiferrobacterales bacterium]